MPIAITGAGNVGSAPSKAAVAAGHTVSLSTATPEKATDGWSRQSGWALLGPAAREARP